MLEGVQLSIEDAIAAGQAGAQRAHDAAARRDPMFRQKAEAAFIAFLRGVPGNQATGEEMVDAARAAGVMPPKDQAFGALITSLRRRGVIRCVGFTVRKKGHGTAGARVWELV